MIAAREEVVRIARSWLRTPYHSNAMVKGIGVDCAMILIAVYREAGVLPPDFDPRPYPTAWNLHMVEEKYLGLTRVFAMEVEDSRPGNVVVFKVGRLFAHGGIVTEWPLVIHAMAYRGVVEENIEQDKIGKHALGRLERRFFSAWED